MKQEKESRIELHKPIIENHGIIIGGALHHVGINLIIKHAGPINCAEAMEGE